MIDKDSLLRRLPAVLAAEQRMRLEALVFSGDVLAHSLGGIRSITTHYGAHLDRFTGSNRAALFSHAWTIVDHIHTIRLVLKSFTADQMGPRQRAFYEKYAVARDMRNAMDHLDQNVPNRAKAGGRSSPLFGTFSYFLVQPHQIDAANSTINGGTIVTITSGSPTGNQTMFPVLNPLGRTVRPPVCLFELTAFDQSINLEDAVIDFEVLLDNMAAKLESEITRNVEEMADKIGEPTEKLLAPLLPSFVLHLDIGFTQSAAPSPPAKSTGQS